jgi:succinyl-CoA synthetase beta subunit
MDLMEYKARALYQTFAIPTTSSITIQNMDELAAGIDLLSFPMVIKAQVPVGGRGKVGGIQFAENTTQLYDQCQKILGMDIKGYAVEKLLIAEKAEIAEELYLSILLDRLTKSPMIIFSTAGGMDIEEVAKTSPEKIVRITIDPLIGIQDYIVRYLISRSGLRESLMDQLGAILRNLYKLFMDTDCMLAEINPLAITPEGRIIALDGKISVDDSALSRHPDLLVYRDSLIEDELILRARKFDFLYIPCEANGNIAVMSNGSGMIMSCIDLIAKADMSVGAALDLGGGATAERIAEAVAIILSNEQIESLFINIFGGITRCDEVALGVQTALAKMDQKKLIIIRVEGTNKDKGLEIINAIQGDVVSVDGIRSGVKVLADRRMGR